MGIGIRGTSPHGAKCWLYYPENDCPFYRYAFIFDDLLEIPLMLCAETTFMLEPTLEIAFSIPAWSLFFVPSCNQRH